MSAKDTDTSTAGGACQYCMGSTEKTSVSVVTAVSSANGVPVAELPLLYDAIDPDALDALFAPDVDGGCRFSGRVSFDYAGVTVTIESRIVTVDANGI